METRSDKDREAGLEEDVKAERPPTSRRGRYQDDTHKDCEQLRTEKTPNSEVPEEQKKDETETKRNEKEM